MKHFFSLLLILAVGVSAKAVLKRDAQNSYGDEPVTTEAPKQEYPQEAPSEAPAEQVPSETPAPAAPVEQSGYRKKRDAQNSYGDEQVTQSTEAAVPAETTAAAVEQAPEGVAAETVAPVDQPPAEKSGYRSKRDAQNSYGDEPVTEAVATEAPKQGYPQEETSAPETPAPEVVPEPVHNEPAPQEAPVEHSGY